MNQVSWTSILIGLALFLFGIDYLSLSLQELSPTRLKNLLAKCTSSTFKAIHAVHSSRKSSFYPTRFAGL